MKARTFSFTFPGPRRAGASESEEDHTNVTSVEASPIEPMEAERWLPNFG